MKKIFVAGATGRVSSFLIDALIDKGYQVIAGARDPKRIPLVSGVEGVKMDLKGSLDDLEKLLEGVDVVYFTAGSRGKDLLQTDAFGAVKLMQAAERVGVKRFIMLSSLNATNPDKWEIYEELNHVDYIIAKFFADNYLINQTNLDYTILQPTTLVEAETGDGKVSLGKLETNQNTIPNVAKVLAELMEHNATIGQIITMSDGTKDVAEAVREVGKTVKDSY